MMRKSASTCRTELLEIYKIFVDSAQRVSDARLKTNAWFVSLNAVLIGTGHFLPRTRCFCLVCSSIVYG